MANYALTTPNLNFGTSTTTVTQHVNIGDTVTVSVICTDWSTDAINNCTRTPTSGSGGTSVVSFASAGSYQIRFACYHSEFGTYRYYTLSGVVSTPPASDTTAPVITRLGSATVSLNVGETYSDAGATATDNVDGTITSSIVTVNPVNVNTAGTYTVTYNVSDAAGNAATQVTRSVTVYIAPDTTITDIDTITRPNGSTNHTITIANGETSHANTIFEVRTVSASGTVYGTRTGNGDITVSSIPSAGTSATYYVTGRVTTANEGNNTAVQADTYIVLHEAASSGGGTGGGGTGAYGLRVYDASGNTTLDVSDRVVTFRERVTGSLSSSQTSKTVTLSGVGTAVINLTPITVIYVGNIPQRQKILYFTISGTSLTIQRTSVNAAGSAAAAQTYDLLVVYDPE